MPITAERQSLIFAVIENNTYGQSMPRADWTRETTLADAGLDSLGKIEIMLELEDSLGIVLEEKDFEGVETLGDILDRIEKVAA